MAKLYIFHEIESFPQLIKGHYYSGTEMESTDAEYTLSNKRLTTTIPENWDFWSQSVEFSKAREKIMSASFNGERQTAG